jgi:hypothetical protein
MTPFTLVERRVLNPTHRMKDLFNLQDLFEDRLQKIVRNLRRDHGDDCLVVIKGPLTTVIKLENGTRMIDVAMLVEVDSDKVPEGTMVRE